MNRERDTANTEVAGHATPATARVLQLTGGWARIIEEEWEWLEEDRQREEHERARHQTTENRK